MREMLKKQDELIKKLVRDIEENKQDSSLKVCNIDECASSYVLQ